MAPVEPLSDTGAEAARVHMDLLRRASPARRLQLALSLSRSVLALSRAGRTKVSWGRRSTPCGSGPSPCGA